MSDPKPYVYQPYPKYVDGVIVQDEAEHEALLAVIEAEKKDERTEDSEAVKPRRGRPPKAE